MLPKIGCSLGQRFSAKVTLLTGLLVVVAGFLCWAAERRSSLRQLRAPQSATQLFVGTPPQLLDWEAATARAKEVEAQMTDEERYSIMAGQGFNKIGGFVGITLPVQRLGIPALKMQDSSGGFRPLNAGDYGSVTSWPSMLTLASSWDESMVARVAAAIGREFRGKGANVLLGPGVNVNRVAYGGRNWEYLSGDDPFLGSRLVPAYIKAVQDEGVMTVVKHYAFNEQETDRQSENSVVAERTAWELYYPPFEAAVKAGVGAVMCSYNRFNGTHACGNEQLLKRDLKERMGFSGFVVSDWHAVHNPYSVQYGTDMEQPRGLQFSKKNLAQVSPPAVREAARRILAAIFRMRFDVSPGCALPCEAERSSNQRTAEHVRLAEEAATDGVVILKNEGILPLDPRRVRTLAVVGPAASATDTMNNWGAGSPYSGGGSGHVASPLVVTPLSGIQERARAAGVKIIADINKTYTNTNSPQATEVASRRLAGLQAVAQADAVVVVAASTATESTDRNSLTLDNGADQLIELLAGQKPVIVLMEIPGPVLTPWRNKVAAAAVLFTGGERTGRAWANILFGDVAPAGKLPVVMPETESDALRPHPGQVYYSEGLFTSYRSPTMSSAFPFGHGLTYTHFEIGQPQKTACRVRLCFTLDVVNVGPRAGRQVVQVYVRFRPDAAEPNLLLRGFYKTRLLAPREKEKVDFALTDRDLSIYDDVKHSWQLQHRYEVLIGLSSEDIRRALYIGSGSTSAYLSRALAVILLACLTVV